jgi:hypothetical protein
MCLRCALRVAVWLQCFRGAFCHVLVAAMLAARGGIFARVWSACALAIAWISRGVMCAGVAAHAVLFCDVLSVVAAGTGGGGGAAGVDARYQKMSEGATPGSLYTLGIVFDALDDVVATRGAYKVETIGSEYMVVSGMPAGCLHPANPSLLMMWVAGAMIEAVRNHGSLSGVRARTALRTALRPPD